MNTLEDGSREGAGDCGPSAAGEQAWYDRLAKLRRETMRKIGPGSSVVVIPALLLAIVPCGIALMLIMVTANANAGDGWYAVSLPRLPGVVVARYPTPVALICCAYFLWAAMRISWWYTKQRIVRQVRLVTCMIHHSNLLLQIADPIYRLEPPAPGKRKVWQNSRRIDRFDDLIKSSSANIDKLWYQSGRDQAAFDRLNLKIQPSDPSACTTASCVALVMFFGFCLVLPFTFMLLPIGILMMISAFIGNYIARRASLVAILDFLVENHGAREYHGWAEPVSIPRR